MALNKEQQECLAHVSTEFGSRYGQLMYSNSFAGMPEELVTEEFCLAVVKKNGIMLQFVPEKLKTQAVCLAAVEELVYAFKHVPEKQMTEAVLLAALSHKGELGPRGAGTSEVISNVPEKVMTAAFCLAAMKTGYFSPAQVPKKLWKDEAFCLAAVKQMAGALQYLPKKLITEAICIAAVEQDISALKYVPEKLKTEALCIAAAKQDISVLHTNQYFPKEVRDKAAAALNAAGSKAKTRKA